MQISAALGHSRPASDFAKIIGDPSDPGGRDHACLKAETQDLVILSSSVLFQLTSPALYLNTEHTAVTMTSSFSGRDRTRSSFKATKRCCISFWTCSFSAEKSPSVVIRTPRCLIGSSGERAAKGSPLRVMLSVAILFPVFMSTPTILDFLVCTSWPVHSRTGHTAWTRLLIAGTASGPSVFTTVSSANTLAPEGSISSAAVHLRFRNLMRTWIGLNTTLYIRGLGCAPCIAPRESIQAALFPNLFFMTRKDPVYILRRSAISAAGKPQASKMEKIAR